MSKKRKPQVNPYCPVPGCRTKAPHTDDKLVNGLLLLTSSSVGYARLTEWARDVMIELRDSMTRDLEAKQYAGYFFRLRQVEELYFRVLYLIFVATPEEIPHVLSGEPPNGLSAMYQKVNELVMEGRGALQKKHAGLTYGEFTAMGMLNSGAHISFLGLLTWQAIPQHPEYLTSERIQAYIEHLQKYVSYLNHIHELFKAGRDKSTVLGALQQMHRPVPIAKTP